MKKFVLFVLILSFILHLPRNANADAGRATIGLPTADLTIFRTVWNLSCHPQNPLLHEVPHYVMYAPDWTPANGVVAHDGSVYKSKGACWAYHNEGNTNFVPHGVGEMGNPGSENEHTPRPNTPIHHYMVMEFPNPVYDPANDEACKSGTIKEKLGSSYKPKNEFCAPYIHWEGYARLKQLAISVREKEVWYVEDFVGGWTMDGKNVIDGYPTHADLFNTPVGTINGKSLYSAVLIVDPRNGITIKTCNGWNHATYPRPGDGEKNDLQDTRPCWQGSGGDGRIFDSRDVPNPLNTSEPAEIHPNPLLFSDIPHSRFMRNPRNDSKVGDSGDPVQDVKHVREWFDDDAESRLLHIPDSRYTNQDDKGDYLVDQADDDWVKCSGQNGQQDIYSTIFNKSYSGKISGGAYDAVSNTTTLSYSGYRDYIKTFMKVLLARARPETPDGETNADPRDSSGARIDIPVAPVVPFNCDYRPLSQDPGVLIEPTTGRVNVGPNPARDPKRLAALVNSWTTTDLLQPTIPPVTPEPTATPDGGSQGTSPTPSYLRSDFGGLGGQKDGKIDIQDLNILAGEFYQTRTTYKADIIRTGDSLNKVDVQDYSAFTNDYNAYLAR